MEFRPCIDIHNGKVKQIVGGSLKDAGDRAQENYLSQQEEKTEFLNGIIEQETLDLLYDAIDELPERYRRIFELNFQQGLKNAEIAALLGVTESAVKKQKAAMIDLVRQSLKKKTGNDLLAFLIVMKYLVP